MMCGKLWLSKKRIHWVVVLFTSVIVPQRELVRNGMVELSVPFNEFIAKLGKKPVIKIDVEKD